MQTRTVIKALLQLASLSVLLAALPAAASNSKDQDACAEVKAKIRAIQDRMRSGYTASQGVRMDAELRRLRDKRRRVCR